MFDYLILKKFLLYMAQDLQIKCKNSFQFIMIGLGFMLTVLAIDWLTYPWFYVIGFVASFLQLVSLIFLIIIMKSVFSQFCMVHRL